jgi:hypothetical protein
MWKKKKHNRDSVQCGWVAHRFSSIPQGLANSSSCFFSKSHNCLTGCFFVVTMEFIFEKFLLLTKSMVTKEKSFMVFLLFYFSMIADLATEFEFTLSNLVTLL